MCVRVLCSFLMVFLCLLLSVFSTIEQYEEVAGTILYHFVSKYIDENSTNMINK